MKKLTFGTSEKYKPSYFCENFSYKESEISYPIDKIGFKRNKRGCVLTLPLGKDEQIYGTGLQLKLFNLRGKKITAKVNADPVGPDGESHAPVPFFVSTAGYGIYVDTARYVEFHFGSSDFLNSIKSKSQSDYKIAMSTDELYNSKYSGESNITIQVPAAEGVDIYIIEGNTITDIVAKYNMLSGGGCDVPDWALSAIYRCCVNYNDKQILELAAELKRDGYSVGTIGLEPGWHSHAYSCTYSWSPERFPEPQCFVDNLMDMGYHINLWEHAFVHPDSPIYEKISHFSCDYSVWQGCVPDFANDEAKAIFSDYHKKIVDMGIDGFKLDECDCSDYTGSWSFPNCAEFPSGLDGEQYHSLFGTLYMQTILKALENHQTLSEVRNAGALAASYPFVLYSDLYDHKDFIRGCATSGFSGILWTPEVRDAADRQEFIRRLQANVFSVQCIINAWYCEEVPWKSLDCAKEVKELLKIREQLKPILKTAFKKYKENGIPPVRALVSDYTSDANTYNINDEYIFCDKLLVAPIAAGENSRTVYLPNGKWRDYFTKELVDSGEFVVETEFIPVYEKMD